MSSRVVFYFSLTAILTFFFYFDLHIIIIFSKKRYTCKDHRPFYVVAPCHVGHQVRCLKALGIYENMVNLGLSTEEQDVYAESSDWKENYVMGTYPLTDPIWIVRFKESMQAA